MGFRKKNMKISSNRKRKNRKEIYLSVGDENMMNNFEIMAYYHNQSLKDAHQYKTNSTTLAIIHTIFYYIKYDGVDLKIRSQGGKIQWSI